MLLVRCPWCGPRDEIEFRYGGQAGLTYPADPEALSDEEWADYLFMRDNPKGPFRERWFHTAGCGEGWHPVVEEAVQRGDRVLLVERDRLAAAAGDGVTVLTNATALGLYDDGYAIVHERGP